VRAKPVLAKVSKRISKAKTVVTKAKAERAKSTVRKKRDVALET